MGTHTHPNKAVAYQVGHRPTPARLRIPLEHPTIGAAWREQASGEPFLEVYLDDIEGAGDLYPDSKWLAAVPVAVSPQDEEENDVNSNLAVVAIIDSPTPLGGLERSDTDLNKFAHDLHELALKFIETADLGRLARRSVSWL